MQVEEAQACAEEHRQRLFSVNLKLAGLIVFHGAQVEEAQARAEEDRQRREGQQCAPAATCPTACCRSRR